MKISLYFFLSCLLVISYPVYSQVEPAYDDTSYFMSLDIDFNLVISASRDHEKNVAALIARGADVNTTTPEGVTPLMYASDNGDLEMVKLLLDHDANPNMQPVSGITALMSAVLQNRFDVAEYLASHGADPNLQDQNGITALNYAAAYNEYKILDMLLYFHGKPDLADYSGNTPLISAAFNNCLETVQILVKNGANINAADINGFTPLMISIQKGNSGITQFLIDQGADISMVNKAGMTALAFALQAGDYSLTEKLIQMGADVNHRISGSKNIYELARESKDEDILELLSSEGARQNFFPDFNRFIAGAGFSFNKGDFTTAMHLGFADSKYHFALKGGFAIRPAAVKVLVENTGTLYHQYRERRYFFFVELEKNFMLFRLNQNVQSGPVLGINELYTFGNYRGSNTRPDPAFITVPRAGWYFSNTWVTVSLNYEYLNLNTNYINPGRISLNADFMIPMKKKKTQVKQIGWLTN